MYCRKTIAWFLSLLLEKVLATSPCVWFWARQLLDWSDAQNPLGLLVAFSTFTGRCKTGWLALHRFLPQQSCLSGQSLLVFIWDLRKIERKSKNRQWLELVLKGLDLVIFYLQHASLWKKSHSNVSPNGKSPQRGRGCAKDQVALSHFDFWKDELRC